MIHKMLSSANMARRLLLDVRSTMSNLVNIFPSIAIGYRSSKEMWLGNVVDYFLLIICDCPRYV